MSRQLVEIDGNSMFLSTGFSKTLFATINLLEVCLDGRQAGKLLNLEVVVLIQMDFTFFFLAQSAG